MEAFVDDALNTIRTAFERPRLRGRLHLATAVASLGGLLWLVEAAHTPTARLAAWVYGITSVLLYLTSGTYHVFARSPRARGIMQRADHSMIYILIAGSATPSIMLLMNGWGRAALLGFMWAGAAVGITLKLVAFDTMGRYSSALYIVLGWAGLFVLPHLIDRPGAVLLLTLAGLLYTIGAGLFATGRPRLWPGWFGYHEVWHLLGVTAGVLLFMLNFGLVSGADAF